ncbi:MAG: methyltransferase domain-containing protein [Nitrososphaerales archaeon]
MRKLIAGTGTTNIKFGKADEVVGIDIVPSYIHSLRKKAHRDIHLCVADVCNLPFRDETFTEIICEDVLEHIIDTKRALEEMCRVIEKGGLLILRVPRAESEYILSSYFKPYRKYIIGREHKHVFQKICLPTQMKVCKDCIMDAYGGLRWFSLATFYNAVRLDSKVKIDARGKITFINASKSELVVAKVLNIFSEILARMFAPVFHIIVPKKSNLGMYIYKSRQVISKKINQAA